MDKKEALGMYLCQLSNYIWDFGYYINKRVTDNKTLELYSVYNKYYEIHITSDNQIVQVSEIGLDNISRNYGMEIAWLVNLEYVNELN